MGKSIVFLGICILLAGFAIAAAWGYNTYTDSKDGLVFDRYYYGVDGDGIIKSVADKYTGEVHYYNGNYWRSNRLAEKWVRWID